MWCIVIYHVCAIIELDETTSVVDPDTDTDPDLVGSENFSRIQILIRKNHSGSRSGQL